jgi:hypothetical protein
VGDELVCTSSVRSARRTSSAASQRSVSFLAVLSFRESFGAGVNGNADAETELVEVLLIGEVEVVDVACEAGPEGKGEFGLKVVDLEARETRKESLAQLACSQRLGTPERRGEEELRNLP